MRLTSQLISALGSLTGTGEPNAGDVTLVIPPSLLLTGWTPFPELIPANLGTIFAGSFSRPFQGTITNTGGGLTDTSFLYVPGIWRIRHTLHMEANWTNANPIALDFVLKLRVSSPTIPESFVFTRAARISSVVVALPPRIYSFNQTMIQVHLIGGNGVGQTSTFEVFTEAERLL